MLQAQCSDVVLHLLLLLVPCLGAICVRVDILVCFLLMGWALCHQTASILVSYPICYISSFYECIWLQK